MKIAFYANHTVWGGLANNGGTNTILKSARTIRGLRNSVSVVSNVDRFTYFTHPKCVKQIPKDVQACIAVGIHDIKPMVAQAPPGAKLFYWMREYPLWKMNRKKIYKTLSKFSKRGEIICNSSWMQWKLARRGIPSNLCFAGMDLNVFKECGRPPAGSGEKITIGALYSKTHKTKNYDFFLELKKHLDKSKYDFIDLGRKELSDVEMAEEYRKCDIWFSPTYLEGFHNCSAEAALCGALLIRTDAPICGQADYSTEENSMIFKDGDLTDALRKIRDADFSLVPKLQEKIINDIGDRKTNMKKFLELIK